MSKLSDQHQAIYDAAATIRDTLERSGEHIRESLRAFAISLGPHLAASRVVSYLLNEDRDAAAHVLTSLDVTGLHELAGVGDQLAELAVLELATRAADELAESFR